MNKKTWIILLAICVLCAAGIITYRIKQNTPVAETEQITESETESELLTETEVMLPETETELELETETETEIPDLIEEQDPESGSSSDDGDDDHSDKTDGDEGFHGLSVDSNVLILETDEEFAID